MKMYATDTTVEVSVDGMTWHDLSGTAMRGALRGLGEPTERAAQSLRDMGIAMHDGNAAAVAYVEFIREMMGPEWIAGLRKAMRDMVEFGRTLPGYESPRRATRRKHRKRMKHRTS